MSDYYDLGGYTRPITTSSADAQRWFDRGLVWCYAYNHEEAVACFQRAGACDSNAAMPFWGIAYAVGPNYNKAWDAFGEEERRTALRSARQAVAAGLRLTDHATPVERVLVESLQSRYQSDELGEEWSIWNDDYASAMREVYSGHGDDLDVACLFAEALINRTPWALWNLATGEPAEGADTLEAVGVLEKAIATAKDTGADPHPGLLHILIHALEMSPHPERALAAADRLRDLVPDAGHLQHMPTHIDVLCGRYEQVVEWNERAIAADRRYLERAGPRNFYTLYRCHDYHFKIYGAMFLGQPGPALETADEMVSTLPEELLRVESPPMADWVEAFVPMRLHVLIRFGMWQEIVDEPLPADPELYSFTTALHHYAKGIAHAALGDVAAAEQQRRLFRDAATRVPETRYLFNNTCRDILRVAEAMLDGEIAYRAGNTEVAFDHLRHAVELDDALPYDEPWGWMQPARHALGALLLEQGRIEEAEAVYRADLGLDDTLSRPCQHPDNVWSLHGYHECLTRLGKTTEADAVRLRLERAKSLATIPIDTSCYCRGMPPTEGVRFPV